MIPAVSFPMQSHSTLLIILNCSKSSILSDINMHVIKCYLQLKYQYLKPPRY